MCRSFEVISGKKNKGDKGLLKGLTKMYRDAKYSVAIIPIPVELLEIDTRYQTEVRTDRSLMYLVNNWDENKLLPFNRCSALGGRQSIPCRRLRQMDSKSDGRQRKIH